MTANGKSRRSYKGAPVNNSLKTSITDTGTSITLNTAMSGWPAAGAPFFCVIDPGSTKEEKVCVIVASTDTLTIVDPDVVSSWTASVNGRNADNTTKRSHDAGAVIYPVFTAYEADEANELVSKYANPGSMVYQGTGALGTATFTELAVGTTGYPLVAGSTVPAYGQLTDVGIASDAVTTAKILNLNVTEGKIADGAVTSAKIADGAIVDADVNASAAIALSKLATGALPTGITVASANIVDLSIVNADVSTSAAIVDTKLATIATAGKVSNSATTATNANTASAIVARDASGNFSAGTVTAALTGNVTGNVTGSSGSCTGNAATATYATSAGSASSATSATSAGSVPASGVTGMKQASSVTTLYNSNGTFAIAHGIGSTPSNVIACNGDYGAISQAVVLTSSDSTYIYGKFLNTTTNPSVRVNWIAFY